MKKILNIMLGILMAITAILLVYALATGGSDTAISLNIIWTYALLVFAICAALFCAGFGLIQNPAGLKGTILSVALIIVIVGVSYFIAAAHTIEVPNVALGGVFGRGETILTDASILVTYVAIVAAFLAAVGTEFWSVFK
ncbi:MAG: hypothetical protein RR410_05390 [Alistipes sp.]